METSIDTIPSTETTTTPPPPPPPTSTTDIAADITADTTITTTEPTSSEIETTTTTVPTPTALQPAAAPATTPEVTTTTTTDVAAELVAPPVVVPPPIKPFKVEIPRISSRDVRPQRAHSPVAELEQCSHLFLGPGAKREPNKLSTKLKSSLDEAIKRAKKFAMEQSVRFALVKQQQQQQKAQLELIKKQQALLLMCRIYVGSIFYEVKEESVRSSFGAFGPIRSISMSWDATTNKHKGFAFIEFETPEAAQLSLEQMNGALLGGRNIKVGRPSNMPQAQPIIEQLTEEAKTYNRIYVASIHPELSEQDVQSVFEAFGTIKTSQLVRDPQTGKHKGYGFIEYETHQSALDAIASMNLFDLGGQFLRVGKAVTPPDTPPQLPIATNLLMRGSATVPGYGTSQHGVGAGVMNSINQMSHVHTAGLVANPLLSSNPVVNSHFNHNLSLAQDQSNTVSSTQIPTLSNKLTGASSVDLSAIVSSLNPSLMHSTTGNSLETPLLSTSSLLASAQTKGVGHGVVGMLAATAPAAAVTAAAAAAAAAAALVGTNGTPLQQASAQAMLLSQQLDRQQQQLVAQGNKIELTENQKQLLGMTSADDPSASLEQQVDITLKGKEQRMILMQKLMQRKPESRVLILRNMIGPDDVDPDLETEITDECGKYGSVERVVIYQERQGEEADAEVLVKIFVEFSHARAIEKAVATLNGRFFGGRVVRAEVYEQSAYDAKDYSG